MILDMAAVADMLLGAVYGSLAGGAALLTVTAWAEERRARRNHAVRTGRAR